MGFIVIDITKIFKQIKISLWAVLFGGFLAASTASAGYTCNQVNELMDQNTIIARVKPVAMVDIEGQASSDATAPSAPTGPTDPKKIYDTYCTICHQTGIAGAPKFHNKADWAPRTGVGIDALVQSAIKGKGGMPPKGTCMQCSEEALKGAIEYMLPK